MSVCAFLFFPFHSQEFGLHKLLFDLCRLPLWVYHLYIANTTATFLLRLFTNCKCYCGFSWFDHTHKHTHTRKHLHIFGAFENFTLNIAVYQFRFRMWFHIRAKHRKTKQNPPKNITTPRIDSDHLYYYTLPLRLLYEEDAMNELNTQRDLDDAHMRVVSSFVPPTITYTLFVCLFVCASTYELSDCENLCICGNFRNQNKSVIHDCHFVTNKLNFPISIYFGFFFFHRSVKRRIDASEKTAAPKGRSLKERRKIESDGMCLVCLLVLSRLLVQAWNNDHFCNLFRDDWVIVESGTQKY